MSATYISVYMCLLHTYLYICACYIHICIYVPATYISVYMCLLHTYLSKKKFCKNCLQVLLFILIFNLETKAKSGFTYSVPNFVKRIT